MNCDLKARWAVLDRDFDEEREEMNACANEELQIDLIWAQGNQSSSLKGKILM